MCYCGLLGHWFVSDDFALLCDFRDLGLDGLTRFLVFGDLGDREFVYWRPGWAALFWLGHALFGTDALGHYALCIAMHATVAVLVVRIGHRHGRSLLAAGSAGVLFAAMPTHVGGVAWIAAAYNVLPAAFLIAVAASAFWRFAANGRPAAARWALAALALSLTFKEAAYSLPPLFASALLLQRRRELRAWLPVALAVGLVLLHYGLCARRAAVAADAATTLVVVAHHLAMYARSIVPLLPADDAVALTLTAGLAALVLWRGSAWSRYCVVWTAAATLPYVVLTHGERFLYFAHVPAALLVGQGIAAGVAALPRARWLVLAAGAAGLVLLGNATRSGVSAHGGAGDECRRVHAFAARERLFERQDLIVDGVPPSLENGLAAMLRLFFGRSPNLVALSVHPRPPFLLYHDRAFDALAADTPVLCLSGPEPRMGTKADVVGDALPLPVLSLAGSCEVLAPGADAVAAMRAKGARLVAEPVLAAAPPCAIREPTRAEIRNVVVALTGITLDVDVDCPCLLVIAFPVPIELGARGTVAIDGERVPVFAADGIFHAVCMPAGSHRVVVQPALP
ncbi:MAG: hypothetical protein ACK501_01995 [Planctomycetota bacterium]